VEIRPEAETFASLRPPEGLTTAVDLLILNAGELVTMAGGPRKGAALKELAIIKNGALAATQGKIVDVGTTEDVLVRVTTDQHTRVIDARGRAVVPGFVDPHTHLCFAGDRADEFAMRLQGATYVEIAAAGGGILSTVQATREATETQLVQLGLKRLNALALTGTTTVEIKSGYGLTTEAEKKMLRAIRQMAVRHPLDIVTTFMGAHEIPPEHKQNPDEYVRLICEEMIPQVQATFCDVFTEKGVFTVAQSERILAAAKRHGMRPKVHADELSDLGGAALAAGVGAISADHLLFAAEAGLKAMAAAGTVAVCLPGTAFCLMNVPYANARKMIDLGCTVALASDYNPGSCPVYSLPFIMALACMNMGLDPAEALAAVTINAAAAIGMERQVGSLEAGKQADVVILDAPSHNHIPYRMGQGLVATVIKRGRLLADEGRIYRQEVS
jgi:imidazolonepropionase